MQVKKLTYLKCLEKESESQRGSDDCFVCLFVLLVCGCSGGANHDLSLYAASYNVLTLHVWVQFSSEENDQRNFIDAIYFSTISEFEPGWEDARAARVDGKSLEEAGRGGLKLARPLFAGCHVPFASAAQRGSSVSAANRSDLQMTFLFYFQ